MHVYANSRDVAPKTTTSSHLRVWWLTKMRGYQVERVTLVPKENFWGGFHCTKNWVIKRH